MKIQSLKSFLFILYFILLSVPVQANTSDLQVQDSLAAKEHFILPFHLVDGFILIDASVNGVEGKLMFDTGTPFSYFLNNNKLNLNKSQKIAEGQAGSGQEIVLYRGDSSVSINFYDKLGDFTTQAPIHTNFSFIEKGITADFLGFIGHGFFKDYEFLIDYDTQVIEFFLIDENEISELKNKLDDNEIVKVLKFNNDASENIPRFELQLGSISIPAHLDTGNQSDLTLTSETKKQLFQENFLEENPHSAWYGEAFDGKKTFNLENAQIQGTPITKIKNLKIEKGDNEARLGYQFLKSYRSLWNFRDKTITFYER